MRKRGRAGALSWPVGPGTRLGLLGNPGAALSAFQQAPLLFPPLCSIHGPAPGPGGRAGEPGTLCRGPVPRNACSCLGAAELCWSGGRPAGCCGHVGWEGRVTLGEGFQTVSFSVELHRPYLLSCQAGLLTSHTKENPTQDAHPPQPPLKGEGSPLAPSGHPFVSVR